MKRFFTTILLGCIGTMLYAQSEKSERSGYFNGAIRLTAGKTLTGSIYYSTEDAALYFKNESTSGIYTPRSVSYFSLYDKGVLRRFYSLEHTDEDNGRKSYYFFEVLEELPDFVVLARLDQMEIRSNAHYMTIANTIGLPTSSFNNPYKPIHSRYQDETLYLLNRKGQLQPYLTTRYVFRFNRIYLKSRVVHRDLLREYFGSAYRRVEEFSLANKLSFDNRNDFLKMVAHYKEIKSRQ